MTEFEKKRLFWTRLGALAAAGVFLLLLALSAFVVVELRSIDRVVTQAEEILASLDEISAQLDTVDWAAAGTLLNDTIRQMQELDLAEIAARLDSVSASLAAIDWAGIAADASAGLASAQEGLQRAMDAIDELDIAALNEAIADLQTVIEPLARLMNRG